MTVHELKQKYHEYENSRDKYGGNTRMKFEATGFFRLHRADRWWIVDPDGHAFLSFGLNHAERHRILHTYNRRFWAGEFGVDPDSDEQAFYPGATPWVAGPVREPAPAHAGRIQQFLRLDVRHREGSVTWSIT